MRLRSSPAVLALVSLLSACGGGGGGGVTAGTGPTGTAPTPTPGPAASPTPTPVAAGCSLRERQDWVAGQLREWYLFPDLLATNVQPAAFGDLDGYIDALVAPARAQRRDRFFTYVTSIAQENAFFNAGQTAGFGFRLAVDGASRRLYVSEAFEGGPALGAGIDRGTELVEVGTNAGNLRNISQILQAEGSAGLNAALGDNNPGTARTFRITDPAGASRVVQVVKADFNLTPVSSRYGARVLNDGGRRVGYINLRTFISTANPALAAAFADFRAQGITELVIDLRYNGGGLISTSHLFGDLMGRNRVAGRDVFSTLAFNAAKAAAENESFTFRARDDSIAPTRVAFIGQGGTASASEVMMNAFIPYLRGNIALVGGNTFGKPVGQIALDRAPCGDRLRVVAFATQNAEGRGDYYDGMRAVMPTTCSAVDDVRQPLGDARENSIRVALDYLAGRGCAPISGGIEGAQARRTGPQLEPLMPERPTVAQREAPGTY